MKRFLLVLALGLVLIWGLSAEIGARANFEVEPGEAGDPEPGGDDHGWGGENNVPGGGGSFTNAGAPAPAPASLNVLLSTWTYSRWVSLQASNARGPLVGTRADYRSFNRGRYSVRK